MSSVCINFSTQTLVRDLKRAAAAVGLFAAIVAVAHCGTGCKPALEPTLSEQAYTADIIACAALAGYPGAYDHEADMRCRATVDCKYGIGPC